MNLTITQPNEAILAMSDRELFRLYDDLRAQAHGEAIGKANHTPAVAARKERWTIVRTIYAGNCPGSAVLAKDSFGDLWVVADDNGPWAIQVGDEAK